MKIVTVNMEGRKNLTRIESFLKNENPDTICLQEAPEFFSLWLEKAGYKTAFAPIVIRNDQGEPFFPEGVMFASRFPFTHKTEYYHRPQAEIVPHDRADRDGTIAAAVIIATVTHPDEGEYVLGTTHVMVTERGVTNDHQRAGVGRLLAILEQEKPHVLCGDFNMPRGVNELYEDFIKKYTDCIPAQYTSSLDRSIHRLGKDPALASPMFESYMVDYIFTQSPYVAENVRLQFGVSDHAAVVGDIDIVDRKG